MAFHLRTRATSRSAAASGLLALLLALAPVQAALATVDIRLFDAADVPRLGAGEGPPLAVGRGASVELEVDGEQVWALPVLNDTGRKRLTIQSFVVKQPEGYRLFYPVLTVVDEAGNTRTLKPKLEFRFEASVLQNDFDLPADARRLLVHTTREFSESGLESSFGPPPRVSARPPDIVAPLMLIAAFMLPPVVLLGAAGTLYLADPPQPALQGESGTCTLGERGLVRLVAE